MCTVVILRRPNHRWPLLLAANRDEMANRPWKAPARHWPELPTVVAGLDELGRGTWLGVNDAGVVAGVLNRLNTLGPAPGRRSRGELPLKALDHGTAAKAAEAIGNIDPHAHRPFNMVLADAGEAFWIRCRATGNGTSAPDAVEIAEIPEGLSMITAYDRNDTNSPRIRRYRLLFEAAAPPDPDQGDWRGWIELLADRRPAEGAGPGGAMTVITETGFGTVSSSLMALPAVGSVNPRDARPICLFAPGRPGEVDFAPVAL